MSTRTSPPADYLPPGIEEMRAAAKTAGVKTFSPDLAADLANLAAGGEIRAPSAYEAEVKAWAARTLPAPESNGRWHRANFSTPDRLEAIDDRFRTRMAYHQRVSDFLRTLEVKNLPGATPLAKAFSCLAMLAKRHKAGGTPSADGETLPIFADEPGEGPAREINEAVETTASLDTSEQQMLGDPKDPAQAREIAEDLLLNPQILKISRHLDTLTKMRVSKEHKLVPDVNGDERRYRPMKHLGEIGKITSGEWALPRRYRLYHRPS